MSKKIIIKPEKTAINTGVSKGTTSINNLTSINLNSNILDYGTGRLRNAKYLANLGYNVSVLDTPEQIANIKEEEKYLFKNIYTTEHDINNKFDIIFCSYVLNVVPEYNIRVFILKNIERLLIDEGIAIVEVRGGHAINNSKTKEIYNDGYILGNGHIKTFQKPYTIEEILSFINKESSLNIINSIKNGDSILIYLKK